MVDYVSPPTVVYYYHLSCQQGHLSFIMSSSSVKDDQEKAAERIWPKFTKEWKISPSALSFTRYLQHEWSRSLCLRQRIAGQSGRCIWRIVVSLRWNCLWNLSDGISVLFLRHSSQPSDALCRKKSDRRSNFHYHVSLQIGGWARLSGEARSWGDHFNAVFASRGF